MGWGHPGTIVPNTVLLWGGVTPCKIVPYPHLKTNILSSSPHPQTSINKCGGSDQCPCRGNPFWEISIWDLHISGKSYVPKNHVLKPCIEQRAITKMTVWTVGSFHGFDLKTHLLGETLPHKCPMWISHFSSYLIIDPFHSNSWILTTSS